MVNPHTNPVFWIFFWNPTAEQQIREWPKKNIPWIFLPTILSDQVTCALLLHLQWLHLPWTHQVSYLQKEVGLGSGGGNFLQPTWLSTSPGGVFYSYPPGGFSNLVKVDFVFFFAFCFSLNVTASLQLKIGRNCPKKKLTFQPLIFRQLLLLVSGSVWLPQFLGSLLVYFLEAWSAGWGNYCDKTFYPKVKLMAHIPKARLVKGPYYPICRDCAIYFSIAVL